MVTGCRLRDVLGHALVFALFVISVTGKAYELESLILAQDERWRQA